MLPKQIIKSILEKEPEIRSVFFTGCGASRSDLYTGYYFLNNNAKRIRTSLHTANEFNYATPEGVDHTAIVICCSLGGTTPETVKAVKTAKDKGANVVAVTHDSSSPLTEFADYVYEFTWEDNYSSKLDKGINVLLLAVEALQQIEGYAHYDEMIDAAAGIYGAVDKMMAEIGTMPEDTAKSFKDAPVIYCMGSGPAEQLAWSFSSCLMMEMQWIESVTFNAGDFFHGPFEMVDKDVCYLICMNSGRTRAMDERAVAFARRFDANVKVIDTKALGLENVVGENVIDYFDPFFISPVMRAIAENIAALRDHPLTVRRYMWKLEY